MARIFTSGFESNNVTIGHEWKDLTGSPTIQTSIKRSGDYAMRCNTTAAQAYVGVEFDESAIADVYVRFYLYIASAPSTDIPVLNIHDGSADQAGIKLKTDRTLQAYGQAVANIGSPSSALSLNTWYRIELRANNSGAATGTLEARLDGVAFATQTASTPDIDAMNFAEFGVVNVNATADLYFDDIAINDTTGSTQTGFPGAGSVGHMHPDGDISTNWGTVEPASPTTHYTKVNEVSADDATSYVARTANSQIDEYSLESASSAGIGAGDTITLAALNARWRATNSSSNTMTFSVGDGTNYESASPNNGTSNVFQMNSDHASSATVDYRPIVTLYDDVGAGSGSISPSDLDGYRIRLDTGTSGSTFQVSQAYLLVEYVPAAAISISVSDTITVTESRTVNTPHFPIEVYEEIFVDDTYGSVGDYFDSDFSNTVSIHGGTAGSGETNQARAQSFVALGENLSALGVSFERTGTPADDVVVNIVKTLGGASLGTASETAPSDDGFYEFYLEFANPVRLTVGNTYYFEITRSSARDTSNYVSAFIDLGNNPYANGQNYTRSNSSWSADGTSSDIGFYTEYKENVKVALVSLINKSDSITVSDQLTDIIKNNAREIRVSDSISVTEASQVFSDANIAVQDNVYLFEGVNRVSNGSFEQDSPGDDVIPTNWTSFGNDPDTYKGVIAENAIDGSQSFKISSTILRDTGIRHNITGLTSGQTYTVSIWAKSLSDVDNASFVLSNEQNGSGGTQTVNGNWSGAYEGRRSLSITPDSTSFEIFLGFGAFGGTSDGTIWFDDIKMHTFEKVELQSYINKTDSITVSEATTLDTPINLSVSDSISTTENIKMLLLSDVRVSDSISTTENVSCITSEPVATVSDNVTISEDIRVELNSDVRTSENITVSEAVSLSQTQADLTISVSDSITVSEVTQQVLTAHVTVSDSITITESLSHVTVNNIAVSDTVTLTESPKTELTSHINVSDTITTSENVLCSLPDPLKVITSDSVTVTDTPIAYRALVDFLLSTSDSITLTDTPIVDTPHVPDPPPSFIFVDGELAVRLTQGTIPHYTRI